MWGKILIIKNQSNKAITLKEIIEKFRNQLIRILEIENDIHYPENSIDQELNNRFDSFINCQDKVTLNKCLEKNKTGFIILQKSGIDFWSKIDLIECENVAYLIDDVKLEYSKIIY